MKKLPGSTLLVAAVVAASSAQAADLTPAAAPRALPPAFSWTGLYAGVNIGYGFGAGGLEWGSAIESNATLMGAWSQSHGANGVVGGGQVGYMHQITPWLVVGAEADIQASDINGQRSYLTGGVAYPEDHITIRSASFIDWFGTLRGRVGVTAPGWSNVLFYGTGGFAYGSVSNTVNVFNVWSTGAFGGMNAFGATRTGWTAGGGVEWSPSAFPGWSLRVEYLYTDLGPVFQNVGSTFSVGDATAFTFIAGQRTPSAFNTVRAGLNWRFNPFAASPIAN